MKKCFVISPIGAQNSPTRVHADQVLKLIVQPAMKKLKNMQALRADELDKPGKITDQMFSEIYKSDLCIAVLTEHNPNVFYELAIAQSINKPTIILISEKDELPFDIKDLRCIYYDIKSGSLEPVINKIISYVKAFEKENWKAEDIFEPYRRFSALYVNQGTLAAHLAVRNFCQRVQGYWLSSGVELGSLSLGIVEFIHEEAMGTLEITGRAYNTEGRLIASWQTIASCINLKKNRLYYYWDGEQSKKPGDRFEGFGEITFFDSANEIFLTGKGEFFDKNLSDIKSTMMKRSDFRRCTENEVNGIRNDYNGKWIGSLVRKEVQK